MTPPIHRDTRVSDALLARPELRRVLPAFHPAFEKLNHPVLGRILPRLVTVADAARVAGVDADALVAVMNLPTGAPLPASAPAPRSAPLPAPDWLDPTKVTELDVVAALAAGGEPLPLILAAVRALAPGAVLTVVAPFEPVPLIGLLARQGWDHHVAWDGDRCRTSFARAAHPRDAPTDAAAAAVALAARLERSAGGSRLDVRGLEPPQPMRLVLAALEDAAHLPLTVVHHREPALLFPHLQEKGLAWDVREQDGAVLVTIHAR